MKITFLAILILSLFTYARAQETESLPLQLTLEIKEKRLCVGKPFTILARIKNVSDKNQIIDERNLWRYIRAKGAFEATKTPIDDENNPAYFTNLLKVPRFMALMGDNFPDEDVPRKYLVTLKPKEIYKDRTIIKQDGFNNFFSVPGEYSFWTGYGQYVDWSAKGVSLFIGHIESGELKFTLSDCKKT